jgi:UDPglucose 6-dehydrogenase
MRNNIQISVVGLWHLGSVTASCLAEKGFKVKAYDHDETIINNFNKGVLPIFEPGLEDLININKKKGTLSFSSDLLSISNSDLIWVTYDTPVNDQDIADVEFVINNTIALFPYFKQDSIVLISSQLPVGSINYLENIFLNKFPDRNVSFTCSPENLRLGKAIDVFMNPDRIIVGIRNEKAKTKLNNILSTISENIIWMKVESAEMTKHALNAFLATSVVFINELAVLCEHVGASANEVEQGLKSELRIGKKAYLRPGSAFDGGTLARDLTYLVEKEIEHNLSSIFFSSILQSNESHKSWVVNKISAEFPSLKGKKIGILGLTYKPGTNTLRRSTAIEICNLLHKKGAKITAFDPSIKNLPSNLENFITLESVIDDVFIGKDAVIVATEWPVFKELRTFDFSRLTNELLIFDANSFLQNELNIPGIRYITIGKSI